MGKKYEVPDTLTIMKALEYAGYQYIRGCGCRGGVCGACATVYRKAGDYKIYTGLACQTVVEPEMYLAQIPFYPANRAELRLRDARRDAGVHLQALPRALPLRRLQRLHKGLSRWTSRSWTTSRRSSAATSRRPPRSPSTASSAACAPAGAWARWPSTTSHSWRAGSTAASWRRRPSTCRRCATTSRPAPSTRSSRSSRPSVRTTLKKIYTEREMEPAMSEESWKPASSVGLA